MIFRQKIVHLLFFFRKELFIILLIAFSLSTGFIKTESLTEPFLEDTKKSVKGEAVSVKLPEHVKEIEIVPAKYVPPKPTDVPKDSDRKWGAARQIDEYTYTMEVVHDDSMASASEIISALNAYRISRGKSALQYDQKLSEYAQGRANGFASKNAMDSHAGFQDFISNQDGFNKMGFYSMGENSSLGYKLQGVHLIEKVFAGDAPHDTNQLNPEWTHVGVGVSGLAVDIIFGGRKQ